MGRKQKKKGARVRVVEFALNSVLANGEKISQLWFFCVRSARESAGVPGGRMTKGTKLAACVLRMTPLPVPRRLFGGCDGNKVGIGIETVAENFVTSCCAEVDAS